mmetsp:Transcript_14359/g.16296  ORF Transcript_14359/g.16296 Transcript_14359/m.16296 type:complete len:242 (-) Transcript_14359:199-924(-)
MDVSTQEVSACIAVAAGALVLGSVFYKKFIAPNNFACNIQCDCGKVKLQIHVPFSSRFVPQTNCYCCCEDCVGFAKHVATKNDPPGQNFLENGFDAVHMVQFYTADVRLEQGGENIQLAEIQKGAPCYRYYAKCCNTPLCLTLRTSWMPICVVYRRLLKEAGKVYDPPKMVLFSDKLEESAKAKVPGNVKQYNGLPAAFLLPAICRLLWGLMAFKSSSNYLGNHVSSSPIECVREESKKDS